MAAGYKGEIWKIEDAIHPLVKLCVQLLSDDPLFFPDQLPIRPVLLHLFFLYDGRRDRSKILAELLKLKK